MGGFSGEDLSPVAREDGVDEEELLVVGVDEGGDFKRLLRGEGLELGVDFVEFVLFHPDFDNCLLIELFEVQKIDEFVLAGETLVHLRIYLLGNRQ